MPLHCPCSSPSALLRERERPVVVAVIPVRVVQVPIDEVVDVVAVRNGFVPAVRAVDVSLVVPGAGVSGGAVRRVPLADLDHMLIDVVFVDVVQVPVVKVVDVAVVHDGGVPAVGAVHVVVALVFVAVHGFSGSGSGCCWVSV